MLYYLLLWYGVISFKAPALNASGCEGGMFYHVRGILFSSMQWSLTNLGFSLVFFICDLCIYIFFLLRLRELLLPWSSALVSGSPAPDHAGISFQEKAIENCITLFFGIGVIWTAIGMRDSLNLALGNLDAESAASLGAWQILKRLVDGGILKALTTTIVGGAGGYAMRITKTLLLGARSAAYYEWRDSQDNQTLLDVLREIRDHVKTP